MSNTSIFFCKIFNFWLYSDIIFENANFGGQLMKRHCSQKIFSKMPNTKFSRQRSKYALGRVNATTQIEITCSELTPLLFKKISEKP